MSSLRFRALEELFNRVPVKVDPPAVKTSEYFGMNVFDKQTMQKYLSKEAFTAVAVATDSGTPIDRKIANEVANGMKAWAIERGATHYTHWFHPLNDSTAEKHDAFFEYDGKGGMFETFHGALLSQQEPDASSLPNGGLRNTFEARGYTAWDPSSPAFIMDRTLCIPTIFVSYTGDALDYKAPLLRSLTVLDKAAVEVCQYFDKDVKKVISTLGWEQEYFLVDDALYQARPDLMLTERTLMGHASAKDQQLSDHYFGSIPERVVAFMQDFEFEAYKLGIPVKTRHNEVAPNQFECAPIYEETNLAVDHNQLIMEVMRKVARHHHFKVLLHEKPYKGVNGSGKHNNWSLATDTGINLLSPGKNPKSNLQFLTFLINTVKAVYDHAELLRASIVSHGNEYRLGAHEAPPAIISVFLGTQLSKILDNLEEAVPNRKMTPDEKTELKLGIGKIPEILLDNTDRNRTSPFAFTGNRFEFRAVGSSANCAAPMIALNAAVANQLKKFKTEVDVIIESGLRKDEAIFQVLQQYIRDSKSIRFEGNGYSEEWIAEAATRGFSNIANAPEALKGYLKSSSIELFENNGIMSRREVEARYEIRLEIYVKKLQIESRVFGDLAVNHIIPTAIRYQNTLIESVQRLKDVFVGDDYNNLSASRMETIRAISRHIGEIKQQVVAMTEARKEANHAENIVVTANLYSTKVKYYLEEIRQHIDDLELIVDDEIWPLPKYRELLFTR